jgi:hypothetical protein
MGACRCVLVAVYQLKKALGIIKSHCERRLCTVCGLPGYSLGPQVASSIGESGILNPAGQVEFRKEGGLEFYFNGIGWDWITGWVGRGQETIFLLSAAFLLA